MELRSLENMETCLKKQMVDDKVQLWKPDAKWAHPGNKGYCNPSISVALKKKKKTDLSTNSKVQMIQIKIIMNFLSI